MAGLELVPEQLWWLFGAIITFYFGARELHHSRDARFASPERVQRLVQNVQAIRSLREDGVAADDTETKAGDGDNAAIKEWKSAN